MNPSEGIALIPENPLCQILTRSELLPLCEVDILSIIYKLIYCPLVELYEALDMLMCLSKSAVFSARQELSMSSVSVCWFVESSTWHTTHLLMV